MCDFFISMNGKKVILNESAFRLLMEQYQMETNLYPLARYIFSLIASNENYKNWVNFPDGYTNGWFTIPIDKEIVDKYVDKNYSMPIDVDVHNMKVNSAPMARLITDENYYTLEINVSHFLKNGVANQNAIISKIAHELTHVYDEKYSKNGDTEDWIEYDNPLYVDDEGKSQAWDQKAKDCLFNISELLKVKELRARANEAYAYFYNDLSPLFAIINKHLDINQNIDADDIIRDMFIETENQSYVKQLYFDIRYLFSKEGKLAVHELYRQHWAKRMFGQNCKEEDIPNILKEKYNEFCRFLYWEFKELLKYVVNTYYLNNQKENNG